MSLPRSTSLCGSGGRGTSRASGGARSTSARDAEPRPSVLATSCPDATLDLTRDEDPRLGGVLMATFELKMPKLGESVTEGTIGKWLKQPGEKVNKYELLVEVQTDKVNTEIPSPVAGTLKEVKVEEGQTVPIGTLLATFETADGDVAAASPAASQRQAPPASPQVAPSRPQPTPPQANDAAAPASSSSAASLSHPRLSSSTAPASAP